MPAYSDGTIDEIGPVGRDQCGQFLCKRRDDVVCQEAPAEQSLGAFVPTMGRFQEIEMDGFDVQDCAGG